jgi:hypothetical protein
MQRRKRWLAVILTNYVNEFSQRRRNMRLKTIWIPLFIVLLFGCAEKSVEEKINSRLIEAMALEEDFQEQQEKITDLETEEQNIYNEIVVSDDLDNAEVEELSEQAIDSINKRAKEVEKEKESIEASQAKFLEIEELLDDLEDQETKEYAEEMFDRMEGRYAAYDDLYAAYQQTLKLEVELYEMFLDEPVQQELTDQIQNINESYEQVLAANEAFNTYTIEYNELKEKFYEKSSLQETTSS